MLMSIRGPVLATVCAVLAAAHASAEPCPAGGPGWLPVSNAPAFHYIDVQGRVVIPMRFEEADSFCDGAAYVVGPTRQGYINARGQYIWSP